MGSESFARYGRDKKNDDVVDKIKETSLKFFLSSDITWKPKGTSLESVIYYLETVNLQ